MAVSRSSSGIVGEVVVSAITRSPIVSCATLSTNVESTPPEKATITDPIGAKIARSRSSFCCNCSVIAFPGSDSFGLKQVGGQIALAGVTEHHRDDLTFSQTLRDLQRCATIRSRGNPDQDSFFARKAPREFRRVLVAALDYFMVRVGVEVFRPEAGPDSLDLVKAGLPARQHRRICGLNRDHQYRVLRVLVQVATRSGNRATGADA